MQANDEKKVRKIPWQIGWQDIVEHFVNQMIIHQEAQRLSSFVPPKKALEETTANFYKGIGLSPMYKSEIARLSIDEKVLNQNLLLILRVAAFKASKLNQEQLKSPETKDDWFKQLKKNAFIRLYANANSYKTLAKLPF